MNKVRRPVLRYHGGKFRLRSWIVGHFPKHKIYVEPFGGAGSVLMYKARSYAEIYNDLDSEVVNVFRVLRDDDKASRLCRLIELTPYARAEFMLSYEDAADDVEQARRTIARAFMGFSSDSVTRPNRGKTGFRNNNHSSGVFSSMDWMRYPEAIRWFCDRLQGVLIENMDAREIIRKFDSRDTLFYLDPPYVLSTRYAGEKSRAYNFEMSDDEHRELAELVHGCKGMFLISGLASQLYDDELFSDWSTDEKDCHGQSTKGSKVNREKLWISPNAITTLRLF